MRAVQKSRHSVASLRCTLLHNEVSASVQVCQLIVALPSSLDRPFLLLLLLLLLLLRGWCICSTAEDYSRTPLRAHSQCVALDLCDFTL